MKRLFLIALALFISGCVPTQYKSAGEVYTKTISSRDPADPSKKTVWVKGPPVRVSGGYVVSLRTRGQWGTPTDHQLYIVLRSNTPRIISDAYDGNANKLPLEIIGVEDLPPGSGGKSGMKLHFAVILSKEYLASAAKSGINIRCVELGGVELSGVKVIKLEPYYIEGYLKKYKELTSKSCEEDCKKRFGKGKLRQGMTIEECIKVLCL
jgi:hypothetical protein